MKSENIVALGLVALGAYFLFFKKAEGTEDVVGGGYTTSVPVQPSFHVFTSATPLPSESLKDAMTRTAEGTPTLHIVENGHQYVRPYTVTKTGTGGKAMTGGGVSSGLAISSTPTTYTTMSTGFEKLARSYGLLGGS